jgi:hypothetical protein
MATKEERKAQRRAKREERKAFKSLRRLKFADITSAVGKSKIDIDLDVAEPKFVTAFNQVWPVLKPILEYAELVKLTGPGADKAIRIVIDLGNRISTGAASDAEQIAFIGTLDTVWGPVKTVLGILSTFTDDKVDAVLNKIVEIGDWITEE